MDEIDATPELQALICYSALHLLKCDSPQKAKTLTRDVAVRILGGRVRKQETYDLKRGYAEIRLMWLPLLKKGFMEGSMARFVSITEKGARALEGYPGGFGPAFMKELLTPAEEFGDNSSSVLKVDPITLTARRKKR